MSTALISAKRNIMKYIPKAVGAAALGMVAYDSHIVGKIQSDVYAKSRDADACAETFNNSQHLSNPSMVTSNLKDGVHRFEMNNNLRHFVNSGIGYFKGACSMIINNVVPFTLGVGALLGKGILAKGSAIGLGAYGIVKIFKDVLGFGHYNDLNKKY